MPYELLDASLYSCFCSIDVKRNREVSLYIRRFCNAYSVSAKGSFMSGTFRQCTETVLYI